MLKHFFQRLFADKPQSVPVLHSLPHRLEVPTAAEWSAEEARVWRTFMDNPTGKALIARGRAVEYANAVAASQDAFHTVHSAGRAAGFTDCLNWLQSMGSDQMISRSSGAQDENLTADREQNGTEPVEPKRHF